MATTSSIDGVEIKQQVSEREERILSPEALAFVAELHRNFNPERRQLLSQRVERQERLNAGEMPTFPEGSAARRDPNWKVAPVPPDLLDRRVEITGPVDRKMMINALNSGANVFMADFEDALSPTWKNVIEGQINLVDAVQGTIRFESPDGRIYQLGDKVATLMVRPRGWHLVEKNVWVDGEPISASLFDFGLYFFHNAANLLAKGSGPYFYLPKLESHLEARLWNDVFEFSQDRLGIPRGTIKATVLIENILAAFEMEEILYELREHAAGLNAGRWDYIFSVIKKFRSRPGFLLPDRAQVTMTVPFMRAYTELLVRTCHKRGAHAIGGMAAFIPNRRDPEVNATALAAVRQDKIREAGDGFDGTWVAHPDLVPVVRPVFDEVLGSKPNQLDKTREDVNVQPADLLNFHIEGGRITEAGLRNNISVGIQYIASWLRGTGAAAIFNLMEDAATAEISRAQVWQWLTNHAATDDGLDITPDRVRKLIQEELGKIRDGLDDEAYAASRLNDAAQLFEQLVCSTEFVDFLTLPAYELIN